MDMADKKRAPFQLRSGNSPFNLWGATVKGAKFLYKKATPVGVAGSTAYNVKKKSKAETFLRDADSWITGGLGAAAIDGIVKYKKGIKKSKEDYKKKHLDKINSKNTHKTSKMKLPSGTHATEGEL